MSGPDPTATRRHWDALADGYDAAKARNQVYYGTLKRLIAGAVPASHRGLVLELGCGTGQILAGLHPAVGLGVDASPRMIERARRLHADAALRFVTGDAGAAVDEAPFDAVIAADLLEHVADWTRVVRVAVAACRPGGRLVFTTPNPLWAGPLLILERLRLKMPEGPHRYVPAAAIARSLRDAGCEVLHLGTHLLVPARLGGVGPRISKAAARLPVARRLGVVQLVVAERRAGDDP